MSAAEPFPADRPVPDDTAMLHYAKGVARAATET
jgi:hypothetical protein